MFRSVEGVEAAMSELTASKNSVGKASNSQKRLLLAWRVSRLVGTREAGGGRRLALAFPVAGARLRERAATCDQARRPYLQVLARGEVWSAITPSQGSAW